MAALIYPLGISRRQEYLIGGIQPQLLVQSMYTFSRQQISLRLRLHLFSLNYLPRRVTQTFIPKKSKVWPNNLLPGHGFWNSCSHQAWKHQEVPSESNTCSLMLSLCSSRPGSSQQLESIVLFLPSLPVDPRIWQYLHVGGNCVHW